MRYFQEYYNTNMIFWVLLIDHIDQVINFQIFKLILRTSFSGLYMHFWVEYPFTSIKTIYFLSLITISFHCSLTDVLLDFYGTIFLNILNNSSGHIISHKNSFCNLSYCTASETTLLFWWHHQTLLFFSFFFLITHSILVRNANISLSPYIYSHQISFFTLKWVTL